MKESCESWQCFSPALRTARSRSSYGSNHLHFDWFLSATREMRNDSGLWRAALGHVRTDEEFVCRHIQLNLPQTENEGAGSTCRPPFNHAIWKA